MKNTFTDPHFGSLRVLRDGQESISMEKDLLLAEQFRVTLCLVSSERAVLPHQYPLFQEIACELLPLPETGRNIVSPANRTIAAAQLAAGNDNPSRTISRFAGVGIRSRPRWRI